VARVTWSPRAVDDLQRIYDYIALDSRRAARAQVSRIRASVRRLASFPESGRSVPDLHGTSFREVIVAPYRIVYIYRHEQNRVRVLAVVHGSRDFPDIKDDQL
jgi:toxin ParE1/3/4